MDEPGLPLPAVRCLSKKQAAAYLGIGVTLLTELGVPCIKLGRRALYDKLDLDLWLDDHKSREHWRAGKECAIWPVQPVSTGDGTLVSGGSMPYYPTVNAYAEALRPSVARKPKRS